LESAKQGNSARKHKITFHQSHSALFLFSEFHRGLLAYRFNQDSVVVALITQVHYQRDSGIERNSAADFVCSKVYGYIKTESS
jgi:hypothetical protein